MSRTTDEILADSGLTRDEWQRARAVVENDWMAFARANGWTKSDASSARRLFRFPLNSDGEFTITAPLTEEQWRVLMDVLEAAKPGLVTNQSTDALAGDGGGA